MATLQNYLSGILSEVSKARATSDYKSAQIAEEYLKDKILKGYSIPRMRISNVEIDLPVAIDSLKESNLINRNVDMDTTADAVYENLCKNFSLSQAEIDKLYSSGISSTIKKQISTTLSRLLTSEDGIPINEADSLSIINDINTYSTLIVVYFKNSVEKSFTLPSTVSVDEMSQMLSKQLCAVFIAKDLSEIKVVAEASQLKDISEKAIFHIKMNVIEDGMEWAISQNQNGELDTKLIPE